MDNVQLEITLRRDVFLRVESSALSDGLELRQWVENALKFYLDDRGDLNSINKRLARLDLLDEVLSRLQRIEDRLDMLD